MKKCLCLFFTFLLAIHAAFSETVDEYLKIGGQYIAEGRLDDARSAVEEAMRLDPDHAQSHFVLGTIYHRLNDMTLALESFSRAIELNATLAEVYFWRAAIYYFYEPLSDHEKALSNFNMAIYLEPENVRYRVGRANFLCATGGNLILAHSDLSKAIEIEPLNHEHYQHRGYFYLETGNPEMALNDFNAAIRLNSEEALNFYFKAATLFVMERYEESLENFNITIQLNINGYQVYFDRGLVHYKLEMYNEALLDFTEAIRKNPNHRTSYFNRAVIYRLLAEQADDPLEAAYYRSGAYLNEQMVNRLDGRRE